MNDLDRRIAELKGWAGFEVREGVFCYAHPKTDRLQDGDHCLALKVGRYGHVDLKPGDEFTNYAAPGSVTRVSDPLAIKVSIGSPWSTSDTKALELVDEMAPVTDREPEWGFMCGCFGKEWNATFYRAAHTKPYGELIVHPDHQFEGNAPTRPEAICRAYIAAMEWKRGRE